MGGYRGRWVELCFRQPVGFDFGLKEKDCSRTNQPAAVDSSFFLLGMER